GARQAYAVSSTASAPGRLSAADGHRCTLAFPTVSGISGPTLFPYTTLFRSQVVGGVRCNSATSIGGGFNTGVVINPGDTLRVDIDRAYNPPFPGDYPMPYWPNSVTNPVTSSNSFTVVAQNPLPHASLPLPDA